MGAGPYLRIDQVNSSQFPKVKAYVTVADGQHKAVTTLSKDDFKMLEDGTPGGKKINVEGFQFKDEGVSIVVVMSANGILKGKPLNDEKRAVVNFISKLNAKNKIAVLAFGDHVKTISGFTADSEKRKDKISKLKVMGSTVVLYDAVWQAKILLKEDLNLPLRRAVIIISDGRDTGSKITFSEVIKEAKTHNIPIYTIGYSLLGTKDLRNLEKMSKATGGLYLKAKKSTMISGILQKMLSQIEKNYIIEFKAAKIEPDDSLHQLTIKTKYKGKTISDTKNFIATVVPISKWVVLLIVMGIIIVLILIGWFVLRQRRIEDIEILGAPSTRVRCDKCGRWMKKDWDECIFCKYFHDT
jgi:VWFA-related protein